MSKAKPARKSSVQEKTNIMFYALESNLKTSILLLPENTKRMQREAASNITSFSFYEIKKKIKREAPFTNLQSICLKLHKHTLLKVCKVKSVRIMSVKG